MKEEIKAKVRLFELHTLAEVILKAILIEQKNLVVTRKGGTGFTRSTSNYRNSSYNKVVTVEPQANTSTDHKNEGSTVGSVTAPSRNSAGVENARNRGGEFKHLTGAEMREKREKNLCFRCDEPYSRDHNSQV